MQITLDYNGIDWKSLVEYDETSRTCLRWRVSRIGRGRSTNKFSGDEAGTLIKKNSTGNYKAYKLAYNKKHYAVSRIVYILFNGIAPDNLSIDHIDRNPLNNKINNLRLVEESVNCRNLSKKSNNISGATGVSFNLVNGYGYWNAECSYRVNNKIERRRKSFSVLKLGNDVAFSAACSWRERVLKELIEIGIGFTETHGT